MKKQFVSLLAFCCTAAFAAPESVADFDIEGFKLGMDEAAVNALLEEKCRDGKINTEEMLAKSYEDILHSKVHTCHLTDTGEYIKLTVAVGKAIVIEGSRDISFSENLPEADKEAMVASVYEKLLEKYGKPTHEGPQDKEIANVDFIVGAYGGPPGACWGDCRISEKSGSRYSISAGEDLYAAAAITVYSSEIRVNRALADKKGVQAADEAFEQAIKAVQNQEEEEAKKQAQQAAESVKF